MRLVDLQNPDPISATREWDAEGAEIFHSTRFGALETQMSLNFHSLGRYGQLAKLVLAVSHPGHPSHRAPHSDSSLIGCSLLFFDWRGPDGDVTEVGALVSSLEDGNATRHAVR